MNMREMAEIGHQNGRHGAIGNQAALEALSLRAQGWKVVDLARRYGIHWKSMSRILNGKHYGHLRPKAG